MDALAQRKALKAKKPTFMRADGHKKKEVGKEWRKPKGLHNKMRLQKRGYRRTIKKGWGSPNSVKYLHPSGKREVIVSCIADLDLLDPKTDGAIISSTVGTRLKVTLVTSAIEKNLTILNLKDPNKFLSEIKARLDKKKEVKEEKAKEKKKKEKEKEEKAKTIEEKVKKEEGQPVDEEERKEKEKKEQDKLLTKPGAI